MAPPPLRRSPLAPGLLALGLLAGCGKGEPDVERPNLVVILVDTLRADAVFDPAGRYDTPNLDALAAEGVAFERSFAHAPMTLPSHTALFASRPPIETGVLNNGQPVPDDLPLLADWLGDYGYETRAVISLGTLVPNGKVGPGLDQGFDEYDVRFWNIAAAEDVHGRLVESLGDWDRDDPLFLFAHYCDPHEPYDLHGGELREAEVRIDGEPVGTVTTSRMSRWDASVDLGEGPHEIEIVGEAPIKVRYLTIGGHRDPLELTWTEGAMQTPGTVFRASFESDGGEEDLRLWLNDALEHDEIRERYAAEVAHVDRYVGELIRELRQRDLYDDSLIVFTSDHGEALGEHDWFGHVQNLTDEMIRVPTLLKLPAGHPRSGDVEARADRLLSHVDVVPTVLELLQVPALPGQKGHSLLSDRPRIHMAQTHKPEAMRDKVGLRDERYKMIYTLDDDSIVMFDLENDPAELTDVFAEKASERPDWADQLRTLARLSVERTRSDSETDAETRRTLDALGY